MSHRPRSTQIEPPQMSATPLGETTSFPFASRSVSGRSEPLASPRFRP
ncbi:BZ3500_MvSof-1268-A1-R1_Chr1-3g02471 [Microbotryum saponariae]|uniref:BZ3500_MvSof-1268-A1-R1_Chr1-3g02471 protein n=1 Tax=Microbotryum saponariae TaxID=289078 RepID=A0A2X0MVT5_9BASI|nr:BZ3500_MvSof-1268-A1-R1_Chr1-3g02471 [Microbotryum saponariae]SCZ96325.1 BZ3501_MvSof-1269-A2-R1_Chr1-3g02074 [Microbotryum saponariae]